MSGIIWLASYPKSGNTWLRAFLHNLLTNAQDPTPLGELDRFCTSLTARGWYDDAAGCSTLSFDEGAVLDLRAAVQRRFTGRSPDNVFVKTHSFLGRRLGRELIDRTQTAGAIYIVRNPADILVSAADHYGVDHNSMAQMMSDPAFRTKDTQEHVSDYIGAWSAHVESWTAASSTRLHVVRYEDLCLNPQVHFTAIASFLGLSPPAERLTRAIRNASFESLSRQEQIHGFKERAPHAAAFFRIGRPGTGQATLSPSVLARVGADHGAQMKRFGYPLAAARS